MNSIDNHSSLDCIHSIMEAIVFCELNKENVDLSDAGYTNQRTLISSLFKGEFNKGQIILRLTVIDSLYSTNAAYSYFSFEEMAEKIYALGDNEQSAEGKQKAARDYFYKIACGEEDDKGLFSEPYGYQKNLCEGSRQMSLLSKYAYYELLQDIHSYPWGFPIYDRLAKEAYPTVRKMLGAKDYYSLPQSDALTIKQYITCLSQLRIAIFGDYKLFRPEGSHKSYQQFDILDAYLWRMGKFSDGNLSLLLGREDYAQFIINMGLDAPIEKGQQTRKENQTYKDKVEADFKRRYPGEKDKEKKFDFNELVLSHLKTDKDPFHNTSEATYLNALLTHWKVFLPYVDALPKRGISFPE